MAGALRRSTPISAPRRLRRRPAALGELKGVTFVGGTKGGAFDIGEATAGRWLREMNAAARAAFPRSAQLRCAHALADGLALPLRLAPIRIIDFGLRQEAGASIYSAPFAQVSAHVRPARRNGKRSAYGTVRWRHVGARPSMLRTLSRLPRFLASVVFRNTAFSSGCKSLCRRPPTLRVCQCGRRHGHGVFRVSHRGTKRRRES